MAYSVQNIIVGAAAVFISVKDSTESTWAGGPALPAFSTTAFAALSADTTNWRHQGFTSEGIEVSYEPEYGEVEVDQLLDAAKLFKQSMTVSVNTTLVEATLQNLLVAWGQQGTSLSGDTLGIAAGNLGDEPVERALAFVGPAPRATNGDKRERVYHVRRALSVEPTSHALRRNEATTIPVSFRLLPDPNFTGQEYGKILDRVVS